MHSPVLYTSTAPHAGPRSGTGEPARDDTLPQVTAALTATALAAGIVAQARRRRRVLAGRAGEERFQTRAGNELALRRRGTAATAVRSSSSSTACCAARTSGTGRRRRSPGAARSSRTRGRATARAITQAGAHGRWTTQWPTSSTSSGTSRAKRAGCARQPLRRRLDRAAGSRHGARSRRRRRARRLEPPAEIQRSTRQAKGQEAITQNLMLMGPSLTLGLGPLLEPPDWLGLIPASERGPLMDQYRDPRLWRAGCANGARCPRASRRSRTATCRGCTARSSRSPPSTPRCSTRSRRICTASSRTSDPPAGTSSWSGPTTSGSCSRAWPPRRSPATSASCSTASRGTRGGTR